MDKIIIQINKINKQVINKTINKKVINKIINKKIMNYNKTKIYKKVKMPIIK